MRSLKIVMLLSILAFCGILAAQNNPKPVSPVIVAKQNFLGQNSNIPTTTLYTPSVDGDFQIIFYGNARTNDTTCNSSLVSTFLWVDDFRSETVVVGTGPGGTGTPLNNNPVPPIHATAGNPIQLSGTYNAASCNASYDIFITVIKD